MEVIPVLKKVYEPNYSISHDLFTYLSAREISVPDSLELQTTSITPDAPIYFNLTAI